MPDYTKQMLKTRSDTNSLMINASNEIEGVLNKTYERIVNQFNLLDDKTTVRAEVYRSKLKNIDSLLNSMGKDISNSIIKNAGKTITNTADSKRQIYEDVAKDKGYNMDWDKVFSQVPKLALNNVINRVWNDGFKFNDRIWNLQNGAKQGINGIMARGIASGQSATSLSKELRNYLIDPTLTPGKTWTTKARKSVNMKGTIHYNALRLARTEINNSYREANIQSNKVSPVTNGMKWNLSASHPRPDICNVWAMSDQYNMGFGVFPADATPIDHPNGLCYLTDVLRPPKEWNKPKSNPQRIELSKAQLEKHLGDISKGQKNAAWNMYNRMNSLLNKGEGIRTIDLVIPNIPPRSTGDGTIRVKIPDIKISKPVSKPKSKPEVIGPSVDRGKMIDTIMAKHSALNNKAKHKLRRILNDAPDELLYLINKSPILYNIEIDKSIRVEHYLQDVITIKPNSSIRVMRHEYGHHIYHKMIDMKGSSMDPNSTWSKFKLAFNNDYKFVMGKGTGGLAGQHSHYRDYMGALTLNKIGYGHTNDYYNKFPGLTGRYTELIANMYDIYCQGGKGWATLKKNSPELTKFWEELIKENAPAIPKPINTKPEQKQPVVPEPEQKQPVVPEPDKDYRQSIINKYKTANLSKSALHEMVKAFENMPEDMLRLCDTLSVCQVIADPNARTSFYRNSQKLIVLKNSKGRNLLKTTRHEFGHHVFNEYVEPNSKLYTTFKQAFDKDALKVVKKGHANTSELGYDGKYLDYFGALTLNKVGYGHTLKYYKDRGIRGQHTEAMANLVDIYSGGGKRYEYLKKNSPEVAKWLESTLEQLGPAIPKPVSTVGSRQIVKVSNYNDDPNKAEDPISDRLSDITLKAKQHIDKLSVDVKKSIYEYSLGAYDELNTRLRNGQKLPTSSKDTRINYNIDKINKDLQTVFKNAPAVQATTYRYVTFEKQQDLLKLINSMNVGSTQVNNQYMSTTITPSKIFGEYRMNDPLNLRMEIKGKSGAYIQPGSSFKEELEVLYNVGTKFKVVDKKQRENGQWFIKLEEV